MSIVNRMDHFTVLSSDLDKTREFYAQFGLEDGPRPAFKFPGLWLYSGDKAILHVISKDAMPSPPDGAIDHIAFHATDLPATVSLLKDQDIDYQLMRLPSPYDAWQLFFRDPCGAMVELTFDKAETAPEEWVETMSASAAVPAE